MFKFEIGKAVKEKTGKAMLTLDPSDIGQIRMMMQSAGTWYTDDATLNLYSDGLAVGRVGGWAIATYL